MKQLHLIASPPTGGESQTLSSEDQELALALGETIKRQLEVESQRRIERLFYAELPQAVQTSERFCKGLGYTPRLMLPVPGLGDERMLREIFTAEFRQSVRGGMTELSASLKVHSIGQSCAWAARSRLALINIFDSLADGEIAIGFAPLVVILLTAWAFAATDETRGVWVRIKPLEGLIFVQQGNGDCLPYVAGIIEAEAPPGAANP